MVRRACRFGKGFEKQQLDVTSDSAGEGIVFVCVVLYFDVMWCDVV